VPYLLNTIGNGRQEKELLHGITLLLSELEKKLKGTGHLVGVSKDIFFLTHTVIFVNSKPLNSTNTVNSNMPFGTRFEGCI
jgi:hypothetical protein